MKVKFLRTIITFFGTFYANTVHELSVEQVNVLVMMNPDDIELVGEQDVD